MKKKSSIFRIEKKHMAFHLMLLVPVILVLIYCYLPMAGIIIAFMNYKPALGFAKSEFVGWDNFVTLFNNPQFVIFYNFIPNRFQGYLSNTKHFL